MKKLLLLSNLGWMSFSIVIFAFGTKKPDSNLSLQQSPPACPDVTGIYPDDFLKGIARYRQYQLSASNHAIGLLTDMHGFQDARSCWYSVDTLKSFICSLEQYREFLSPQLKHAELGIRFYYATYDRSEMQPAYRAPNILYPYPDNTDSVGMHHTLFMVPTINQVDDSIPLDFDPRLTLTATALARKNKQINADATILVSMADAVKNPLYKNRPLYILAKTHYPANSAKPNPDGKNQGMLCPPTCPPPANTVLANADAAYPKISEN